MPVPSNIENVQSLDKYVKELQVENGKSYTVNHNENYKRDAGKGYGSFLAIIQIMVYYGRTNLIPENEVTAAAGHNDIALLCEQTILLVGQVFLLAYQRRVNILSTLTENNTMAKEILNERTLEMDSILWKWIVLITFTCFLMNLKRNYPKQ